MRGLLPLEVLLGESWGPWSTANTTVMSAARCERRSVWALPVRCPFGSLPRWTGRTGAAAGLSRGKREIPILQSEASQCLTPRPAATGRQGLRVTRTLALGSEHHCVCVAAFLHRSPGMPGLFFLPLGSSIDLEWVDGTTRSPEDGELVRVRPAGPEHCPCGLEGTASLQQGAV